MRIFTCIFLVFMLLSVSSCMTIKNPTINVTMTGSASGKQEINIGNKTIPFTIRDVTVPVMGGIIP